tara:strand:- start:243 stop:1349 length:1107 start_codon:yes stop_codon:yes gene_type:complete
MTSYSSFPEHQLVTENWRAHMAPDQPLDEALNMKDLLKDALQVVASTGAVVGTAGAGGDVVTDSFFAMDTAKDVLVEVEGLLGELSTLAAVAASVATLNYGANPVLFYAQVKRTLKKAVSSGSAGRDIKAFIIEVQEATEIIIERIIRAISKFVSALLPDDFGLGGPAFEATMSKAVFGAAENSYNLASAGIKSLGKTGKLLTDADALQAFLTKMVESIIGSAKKAHEMLENPEGFSEKINALGAKVISKHPAIALYKWATDTPSILEKVISLLEEAKETWIPTVVKVMRKLIALLFAAVGVFQLIMDPKEREEVLNVEVGEFDVTDPVGLDADKELPRVAESLIKKHSSFPEHQLVTENWRRYLLTT